MDASELKPDPSAPERGFVFYRRDGSVEVRRLMALGANYNAWCDYPAYCPILSPDDWFNPRQDVAWYMVVEGHQYPSAMETPLKCACEPGTTNELHAHCDIMAEASLGPSMRIREYCRALERKLAERELLHPTERILPLDCTAPQSGPQTS